MALSLRSEGEDFSNVFNHWNVLEHTVMDFRAALLKVFSLRFSIDKEYRNKGLVLHLNYLKEKGYSYESAEMIFNLYYMETLLKANLGYDDMEVEELFNKFKYLESFKFNFILENGEKILFDFTNENNNLGGYIKHLDNFFKTDYVGNVDIEYLE